MQRVPVIKNGNLYIQNFTTSHHERVNFPDRVVSVKLRDLDDFSADFLDESGYIYNLKLDGSYTQYKDITEVKDFYFNERQTYIIKDDGSLLSKQINGFQNVKLFGDLENPHVKFDKIDGKSITVVVIDEFGNLWSNIFNTFGTDNFSQITKDIVFVCAEFNRSTISGIDYDGNVYTITITSRHGEYISDCKKINIMDLRFIQCSYLDNNLYVIDNNHNLWVGNLKRTGPFKIINTDVESMVVIMFNYFILLTDGTLISQYFDRNIDLEEDEEDEENEEAEELNHLIYQAWIYVSTRNHARIRPPNGQNPVQINPFAYEKWWAKGEEGTADMKFDKLPNIMDKKQKRFETTKSARNFK